MRTRWSQAVIIEIIGSLSKNDEQGRTLQMQLVTRMKEAIRLGRLPAGVRLPPSRVLAAELGVSRNTVVLAYEQLVAGGYVFASRKGTWVSSISTGVALSNSDMRAARMDAHSAGFLQLAQTLPACAPSDSRYPLSPGVPALDQFPHRAWRRELDRAAEAGAWEIMGYGDPCGDPALRAAIAEHLNVARGVKCDKSQVVITSGALAATDLCVRLFSNPGDVAWVEEPGFRGAKAAFRMGGLRIVPIKVDENGIVASEREWNACVPRLVYTTPNHQYPTGTVLPLSRRHDLISRAIEYGSWIIEDDYDGEFRHDGEPVPSMQGLVPCAPVLYIGSFSKTLFPALRIGFLVLPPGIGARVQVALRELLRAGHRIEQRALARFISSGQFNHHLSRMRRLYRERQAALLEALDTCLDFPVEVLGARYGMHLALRLPPEIPDRDVVARTQAAGLGARALSDSMYEPDSTMNGLLIGYGNTAIDQFPASIGKLSEAIRMVAKGE